MILKVEDERVYEIITDKVQPWSYGRFMSRFPDATNTLRQSMSQNPYLKLFVASGYYDLATPPTTVTYSLDHLRLPAELQKNIDHKFYEGGHMMYIHEPSMKKLRGDIEAFYKSIQVLRRGAITFASICLHCSVQFKCRLLAVATRLLLKIMPLHSESGRRNVAAIFGLSKSHVNTLQGVSKLRTVVNPASTVARAYVVAIIACSETLRSTSFSRR